MVSGGTLSQGEAEDIPEVGFAVAEEGHEIDVAGAEFIECGDALDITAATAQRMPSIRNSIVSLNSRADPTGTLALLRVFQRSTM